MADRAQSAAAANTARTFVFPDALRPISERLANGGHSAYWVGPSLLRLVEHGRPDSFTLVTDATRPQLTTLFPTAVPLGDSREPVMIPTPVGPVDVLGQRPEIGDELARVDFTMHAIAYDEREDALLDPFDGLSDLAAGRLRAVGSAADRLAEHPLRGLRAIRLVATRGLALDPALQAAIAATPAGLASVARIRVRAELVAMLLAPAVSSAWPAFERTGISESLAPGARADAGAVIEQLPCELSLRLAGWLVGTRARRALQRLRFSRPLVDRVEHLLQRHPIESSVEPERSSAVARFARRESLRDQHALIALRRAEIRAGRGGAGALERLQRIEQALSDERQKEPTRPRLAIDGEQVMSELECGPGPNVGRALAYLAEQVAANPRLNQPDELRTLLRRWRTPEPDA